ncbi:hypothetical protein [Rhizobium leguminosarum]|uniref:Uncharacterized protein n=1 Tax=Rhizobium leguminosarum TaxID=384 RepID=A0A1B1CHP5_RHILE|nr:hypothetical protein [Rhizobium leguminosarum]ANP89293.1 hypothetical protein BA011_26320 [Rhizobium leguminosarum]
MQGTANSDRPWIAFIDLLGTKDSAKIKKNEYPDKIRTFSRTLQEQAQHIKANTKVRYFSDSVYIECDDAIELLKFATRLRWILFSSEIFFKSALCEGRLEEVSNSREETASDSHVIDISGASFGPAAVAVYYSQENFKGIGFSVDRASITEKIEPFICRSSFPVGPEKGKWVQYFDIKYLEVEIGGVVDSDSAIDDSEVNLAFMDCLLEAALRANAKRKNLSRYYLSSLITAIQSSDFSKIELHNKKWQNYPVTFYHMMMNARNTKNYMSLSGSEAIYLTIANRIFSSETERGLPRYNDPHEDAICNEIVRMLNNLKILRQPIEELPNSILDHDIADNIARRAVSIRMK